MSLPRQWNFQDSRGSLHWVDGPTGKDPFKEDFYGDSFKHSTYSFKIPNIDEIPITIPAIKSLLAECNVGSLNSIQSAPPNSIEQATGSIESPKRPASLVLEPEIPLVRTDALHYPPPSEIDEEDNENLLTVSSVTARPLIAKSREITKKRQTRRDHKQRYLEPPDGGYGWVIVMGAFSVLFWVTGLVKSYGVLYVEIMENFPNSSASVASWIPAVLSSLCLALAPVSSALCERFSCRIVVFMGGLFCAAGLMLSYFATSLMHLLFTFGVLTGIGGGLSTTPGIILVSRYFDKRRALANGICISGTAAGSFIFPILIEYLVGHYGFHGTILILGGCMLHVCVSAVMYRPLEMELQTFKSNSETNLSACRENGSFDESSNNRGLDWLFTGESKVQEKIPEVNKGDENESDEDKDFVDVNVHLRPMPSIKNSGILHSVEDLSTDSTCYFRSRNSITSSHRGSSRRRRDTLQPPQPIHMSNDEIIIKIQNFEPNNALKDDTNGLGTNRGLSKSMTIPTPVGDHHNFIEQENRMSQRSCCGKIKKYIDITLLKNLRFMLMCSTVTLMSTGVPYMLYYLPAYVISIGYTKTEAGYLVATSAIMDLIGRLGFGYLSDLQLFDRKKAYGSFIFGAGVAAMMIPSVNTWYLVSISAGCYGLFLGCWYLLIPVLLADMFGTDRISSSYGLVRLFQSVTAITVPPLAGYLRDTSGSYEVVFYTMGVCMVLGSLPLLVVILLERQSDGETDDDNEGGKKP